MVQHGGDSVAGKDSEVDRGHRLLREQVRPDPAPDDGHRRGGPDQSVGGVRSGESPFGHLSGPIEVFEQSSLGPAHRRCQSIEQRPLGGQSRRHRLPLQCGYGGGHLADRGLLRWKRRVAPGGAGRDLDVDGRLLADADEGQWRRDPGNHVRDHRTALIQHETETDTPLPQELGYQRGTVGASRLLVMAECEIDRRTGRKALGEEAFDSVEDTDQSDLVVEGSPAPEVLLGAIAREGPVLPIVLSPRLDGNNILMRH